MTAVSKGLPFTAVCKFCQRSLTVQVDPDYDAIGDKYRLLELAVCNRCADHRVNRLSIEKQVITICTLLSRMTGEARLTKSAKLQSVIERMMKRYQQIIGEWNRQTAWPTTYDPSVAEALLAAPEQCADILSRCWRVGR